MLYSRRFSRYNAPIYWLVHDHMTSNNETVHRQMPWAGSIAKTMTPNGKQFTVIREMLTAVARDQSVQLKVAWCCRWNLIRVIFEICFCFVLLYNKSLNDWSLGEQWSLFPSTSSREILRFSEKKIHCSTRDQSLSVLNCLGLNRLVCSRRHSCGISDS